jgi:DnaJ-class molecular chaperone
MGRTTTSRTTRRAVCTKSRLFFCRWPQSVPAGGGRIAHAQPPGNTIVRIPPGTQANAVLRLRGKGLPRFGGTGQGDLLVRLELAVPTRISSQERALYQQLAALQGTGHVPS